MAELKPKSFFSVLMVNETGDRYEQIDRIMDKTDLNIFYLKGGISAYGNYLQGLALSWQPRESRTRTIRKCSSCGSKNEKESSRNHESTKARNIE